MTRAILTGLLLASLSTGAVAAPQSASLTVSASDFVSSAARARLDRRISVAVEQVCGSYATLESYQTAAMDACWETARAEVAQRLAARHAIPASQLAGN